MSDNKKQDTVGREIDEAALSQLFTTTAEPPDGLQLGRMTAKLKGIPTHRQHWGWLWAPAGLVTLGGVATAVWWTGLSDPNKGPTVEPGNGASEIVLAAAEMAADPDSEVPPFLDWELDPTGDDEDGGFDALLPPDVDDDEALMWVEVLDEVLEDLK